MYAEALEERNTRYKKDAEDTRVQLKTVKIKGSEAVPEGTETTGLEIRTTEAILAALRGEEHPVDKAIAEERAEGEIEAGDTETLVEAELERPPEMAAEPKMTAMTAPVGGRLTESEIDSDEIDATPKIRAIENMIHEVKRMEALHSDEEIEKIFKGSKRDPPQS